MNICWLSTDNIYTDEPAKSAIAQPFQPNTQPDLAKTLVVLHKECPEASVSITLGIPYFRPHGQTNTSHRKSDLHNGASHQ